MCDERRKVLGRRLRAARKRSKMSQDLVADSLGVTRQALSAWETGCSCPSALQVADLAAVYCECAHALLFGEAWEPLDLRTLMSAGERV